MLKILHTSDWHLGNVLYGYDRIESEKSFLQQLCNIVSSEKPDCMIVSGDIYNVSNPAANVQKIYTNAILEIHKICPNMTIIVISGNHDSPSKLEIDSRLWSYFNVFVVGGIERIQTDSQTLDYSLDLQKHIIEIKSENGNVKGYVAAVPYFYNRNYPNLFEKVEEFVKQLNTNNLPTILSCHLAVSGSEIKSNSVHVQDMEFYPLEKLGDMYDYVALGHIHLPQTLKNSDRKARYSGSPISISFNESYPHSISIVEIDDERKTSIRTIEIEDNMPLKTIPQESQRIENVFEYIEKNKEELKNCYLRLNVRVDDFLPSNSKDKATEICEKIGAYFCTFNIERDNIANQTYTKNIVTVEEFKQMSVMDVAKNYLRKNNIEMGKDFEQMLSYAIDFEEKEV